MDDASCPCWLWFSQAHMGVVHSILLIVITPPRHFPIQPVCSEVDGEDAEIPRGPFDSGLGVRIQVGCKNVCSC